jgi:hypothetical protein
MRVANGHGDLMPRIDPYSNSPSKCQRKARTTYTGFAERGRIFWPAYLDDAEPREAAITTYHRGYHKSLGCPRGKDEDMTARTTAQLLEALTDQNCVESG